MLEKTPNQIACISQATDVRVVDEMKKKKLDKGKTCVRNGNRKKHDGDEPNERTHSHFSVREQKRRKK